MSEKIFNINNINNNNNDLLVDSKSSISDYYRGKSILITGATGFCGKVILAKLLDSLGIIEKVYILIRPKNGISGAERFEKMINDRPFSFRPISTSLIHKIRVIEGDAIEKNLGLTENETNELISHVNLIIHVAASVKFIATVRYNMQHNVYSAKILVDLASKMEKLDCFVYVSSAYSNCHLTEIDEKLYPLKISSHEIINLFRILGDETAEMVAQELFEGRPNSYVFSKAVAEHIVHGLTKYNKTVSIVRPSIVAPSFEFPVPGWVDSINGPMSLALLWCTGLMCVIDYDFVTTTDFVPVDVVAYGVLAAPWFVSKSKTNFKIFNLVRKDFIKGDWDSYEFLKSGQRSFMKAPPSIVMRPNHKPCRFNDRPRWKYLVERFFYHTIYAFLLDIIIFILGHRPLLLRNVKKMHAAVDAMKYFGERQWIFRSENTLEMIRSMSPADLDEYRLSKSALSCSDICDIFWMGTRRYILKQSEKSIKSAKKRYLISIFVYRIFLAMIFYLLIQLVWPLFSGVLPDFFCRKVFAISICCIMIARDLRILAPLLSEKPSYDLMNNRKDKNGMKKLQNDG